MMPAEALSSLRSLGFSPLTLVCQADTPFLRGPPAFPTFLSLLSDSLSGGELSPQLLGKCHTGPCCSRGGEGGNVIGGENNNIFFFIALAAFRSSVCAVKVPHPGVPTAAAAAAAAASICVFRVKHLLSVHLALTRLITSPTLLLCCNQPRCGQRLDLKSPRAPGCPPPPAEGLPQQPAPKHQCKQSSFLRKAGLVGSISPDQHSSGATWSGPLSHSGTLM